MASAPLVGRVHPLDAGRLIKMCVIGDSSVGKSSLVARRRMPLHLATIGVDYATHRLDDREVKLSVWDTAGQERFRSITRSYYRGCHAIVIVCSPDLPGSIARVGEWAEAAREANPTAACFLAFHKCDLSNQHPGSLEAAARMAERHRLPMVATSVDGDAQTGVDTLFAAIADTCRGRPRAPPPPPPPRRRRACC